MGELDNHRAYEWIDQERMLSHLHYFPKQCREAWGKAKKFQLPADYVKVDKIVILGMGGSAIGGDLLRSMTSSLNSPIIFVQRNYDLPAFVNEKTLIIASSYSGMTEETISAFSQALTTRAKKLVITTGGKLAALAEEHKVPIFTIEYSSPPRVALGYSLFPLLAFSDTLGFLQDEPKIEETIRVLEMLEEKISETVPTYLNAAKQLATKLKGKLIAIYSAGILAEVARRWKTQLNENAKTWAFYEVFPELSHNAVVGYQFPEELVSKVFVVLLRSPSLNHKILAHCQITSEILSKAGVEYQIVDSFGDSPLSQIMSLVYFGDWVSYYLAILYEIDPTPVKVIDYLKERLSSA